MFIWSFNLMFKFLSYTELITRLVGQKKSFGEHLSRYTIDDRIYFFI